MTGGIANGDINFLHDLVGAGGRVGEGCGRVEEGEGLRSGVMELRDDKVRVKVA